MRRIFYLLAVIAIVATSLIYHRVREDRWRPFPGGGEIRLLTVTHGELNYADTDGAITRKLRRWLSPRWSRFLGPPPLICRLKCDHPCLVVWVVTRNVNRENARAFHGVLPTLLPEEDHRSLGVSATSRTDRELFAIMFASPPRKERHLHLRLEKDGQVLDFHLLNPRYSSEAYEPPPMR